MLITFVLGSFLPKTNNTKLLIQHCVGDGRRVSLYTEATNIIFGPGIEGSQKIATTVVVGFVVVVVVVVVAVFEKCLRLC